MKWKQKEYAAQVQLKEHRRRLVLILILTAVGVVLAIWLVWIHLSLKTELDSGSFCNLGGYFDCDIVNSSRFASVLGVPVAYGALATYLLLAALSAAELRGSRKHRTLAYARGLGAFAVAYSVYLGFISASVLHALCVFCVGLYVVNAGVAAVGWWRPPAPRLGFFGVLADDVKLLFAGFEIWPAQLGLIALVGGGVCLRQIGLSAQSEEQIFSGSVVASGKITRVAAGHEEGPADAPLVVIEFIDFECPFCKRAAVLVDQLRSQYAGRVRFVLKHHPLDRACNSALRHGPHRRACQAAEAAVCAGRQRRLWQFQTEVFSRGVADDELEEAAQAAGLDLPAWRQCRWGNNAREAIAADIEDGVRIGVRGTPTFIVGDRMIAGGKVLEELPREIARQLEERRETPPIPALTRATGATPG